MVTATSGGSGTYTYDGEGKRVKRTLAGGQEWWYVYGIGGELLAEYLSSAPTAVKKEYGHRGEQLLVVWDADKNGDERLKWLIQDHLGSTRMEADKSGRLEDDPATTNVVEGIRRHDYAPFGEEIYAGIRQNGGQGRYGYEPPQSNVKQRFTGKERDGETGLDYFGFRYFSSTQGRFTSPDAPFADQHRDNPQSWNLYAYARGNPCIYIDTNGQWLKHVHEAIIDKFFGMWSKRDRQILKDASKWLDSSEGGAWDANNAYMHSLSPPGLGSHASARKTKAWLQDLHTRFKKATSTKDELWIFGLALHTVEDNTSPSHEGFRTWNPVSEHPLDALGHAVGEAGFPGPVGDPYRLGMTLGAAYEVTSIFYGEEAAIRAYATQLGSATDPNVRSLMSFYSTRGRETERLQAEAVHVYRLGIKQGRARTRKLFEAWS